MKTIILSIMLYLSANAQNVWYVDINSPTKGNPSASNGRSWATAWDSMDSLAIDPKSGINWNVISGGDIIEIKAGRYNNQRIDRGLANDNDFSFPVRIRPYGGDVIFGVDSIVKCDGTTNGTQAFRLIASDNDMAQALHGMLAHNKTDNTYAMVLDAESSTSVLLDADIFVNGDEYELLWGGNALEIWNVSNLYFENMKFLIDIPIRSGGSIVCQDSNLVFDNYSVISDGWGGNMTLTHSKNVLKNGIFYMKENSMRYENDPMSMKGRGGHIVDNNFFYVNQHDTLGETHPDMIQATWLGTDDGSNPQTIISNNIFYNGSEDQVNNNAFIYQNELGGNQRFLIYNNIFVSRSNEVPNMSIFRMGDHPNGFSNSIRILNNTIIAKGISNNGNQIYNIDWADTVIIKNNLFLKDIPVTLMAALGDNLGNGSAAVNLFQVDYNAYAEYGAHEADFGYYTPSYRTFTSWKGLGLDVHSDTTNTMNVTWSNKYDTTSAGYYTTWGRDAGVNLSAEYPFLAYDILGNPRTGSWDMGALEFQDGGQSNSVNVKSKVLLQGPFNTNSMNTNLSQNGLLPVTQPFNTTPWNYNGNETLGSGSTSSYVDWVLVELRNSSNPTQIVARKAAILKNDGTLLNTDGNAGVPFSNVQEGSYYIAVFQRNHLAVMSTTPVQLSANSQVYDFTTGMDKAYGTNPMKDLGNGRFGMYAGDGNGNGGITITDRNEMWLPQNGTMGYLQGDFNLDGGVTASDVNLYWNINNGTMTQVP